MSNPDENLDQLLRASGEQWRASEPEFEPFSVATLVRQRGQARSRSFSLPLGAAASLAVVLFVAVALLALYSVGPLGSHPSSLASSTPTASLLAVIPASPTPPVSAPPSPSPTSNPGLAACAAIIGNIPMVKVKTGAPTIAAAYEVTGEQMTRYFDAVLNQGGNNGADWWNSPTKTVDMCVFDGDFEAETPGLPGDDTNATRVLVVSDSSDTMSWAFCFSSQSSCEISLADPATFGATPSVALTFSPPPSSSAATDGP